MKAIMQIYCNDPLNAWTVDCCKIGVIFKNKFQTQ